MSIADRIAADLLLAAAQSPADAVAAYTAYRQPLLELSYKHRYPQQAGLLYVAAQDLGQRALQKPAGEPSALTEQCRQAANILTGVATLVQRLNDAHIPEEKLSDSRRLQPAEYDCLKQMRNDFLRAAALNRLSVAGLLPGSPEQREYTAFARFCIAADHALAKADATPPAPP